MDDYFCEVGALLKAIMCQFPETVAFVCESPEWIAVMEILREHEPHVHTDLLNFSTDYHSLNKL